MVFWRRRRSTRCAAGGYRPDAITVRQVLVHTSGIYDVGQDPAYQAAVNADPAKRWTRLEQVRFAMDHGAPVGEPGTVYAYSDTGYSLLGEIIERATGTPLADAYRTLLDFERPAPRRDLPRIIGAGAARQRRPRPPVRWRHRRVRCGPVVRSVRRRRARVDRR